MPLSYAENGFCKMAIVLPAIFMTRDSRSCSSNRCQPGLADRSKLTLINPLRIVHARAKTAFDLRKDCQDRFLGVHATNPASFALHAAMTK